VEVLEEVQELQVLEGQEQLMKDISEVQSQGLKVEVVVELLKQVTQTLAVTEEMDLLYQSQVHLLLTLVVVVEQVMALLQTEVQVVVETEVLGQLLMRQQTPEEVEAEEHIVVMVVLEVRVFLF
jgi:hypothetical protein